MNELEKDCREGRLNDSRNLPQSDAVATDASEIVKLISQEKGESIPSIVKDDNPIEGLGGWLILVNIQIFLHIIRFFTRMMPAAFPFFFGNILKRLITPSSDLYNPKIFMFICFYVFLSLTIFVTSLYLWYLFYTKKRSFPMTYIIFNIYQLFVLIILGCIDVHGISDFNNNSNQYFISLIGGILFNIVWIPYMLASKRVKNTFINS